MENTTEYIIKEDKILRKCTKEEYDEYMKEKKSNKIKSICASCRVCTCDKIKFSNIRRSDEVITGAYKRTKIKLNESPEIVRNAYDVYFDVYECSSFEPYRDVIITQQKVLKKQILQIDEEILKLKYLPSNCKVEELEKKLKILRNDRQTKLDLITDESILDTLRKSEANLKVQFSKTLQK